jgi:hypothetical protein
MSFEVWYAIPSASPERCRQTLPRWRAQGYKIAVLQNVERGEIPADLAVWANAYPGWAESINILTRTVVPRTAALVVSGGCDMLPDPNHDAQSLAGDFFRRFPDGFGVMQPHGDEFRNARHYCGSPFLGRGWIDTMYQGHGPMCGAYRHNWADLELYWVAKGLGALWERPDLTHWHEHLDRARAVTPGWWTRNVQSHDRHDVELYLRRAGANFPGHEPVGAKRRFDRSVMERDEVRLAERHYATHYQGAEGSRAEARMGAAIDALAERGAVPVAIYGAGAHTRRAAPAIHARTAQVACIIDDHPGRRGAMLLGLPVVEPKAALAMGVRAVVLSSDVHEEALAERCGEFRSRGVEVVALYGAELAPIS